MSLSPVAYFGALDPTNPVGTDSRTISDDQHRNILQSMRDQAPNWTGQITATHSDVNTIAGYAAGGVKPMPGQATVTVLYAYNSSTPPLGWTIEEPDVNVRELIIGPSASGGTIGGSDDPTSFSYSKTVTINFPANTGDHTLTEAQTPTGHIRNNRQADASSSGQSAIRGVVDNTGASFGQAHNHPIGGSDTDDVSFTFTPRYARGILMKFTG